MKLIFLGRFLLVLAFGIIIIPTSYSASEAVKCKQAIKTAKDRNAIRAYTKSIKACKAYQMCASKAASGDKTLSKCRSTCSVKRGSEQVKCLRDCLGSGSKTNKSGSKKIQELCGHLLKANNCGRVKEGFWSTISKSSQKDAITLACGVLFDGL